MFKHVICSNKTTYLVALSWTYHFKAFSLFPPATPAANFAEEVPPEDSASSCRQGCIPGPSSVRNLAVQKKKKGYSPLLTYSPYAKNGAGISGILVNIPYMEHMGSTVCVSGACKLTFGSVSHEFSCSSTTGMGQNWVPQGRAVSHRPVKLWSVASSFDSKTLFYVVKTIINHPPVITIFIGGI
jgi:hypothetical protein